MKQLESSPAAENCRGGWGDSAPATTIDLRRRGDVALVHRAVANGWNVPQHVRDQLMQQLTPALASAANDRLALKLVKLAVMMEARNMIGEGHRKSLFKY